MRRHAPKTELSPMALTRLKAQTWRMPWIDRAEVLVATIIAHEREALATSLALTALVARISEACSAANKIRIAESLRNAADILDHELQRDRIVCDVTQRD